MAKERVRIVWDEAALASIQRLPEVRQVMIEEGTQVLNEAIATAQDAQGGPGGDLAGYAEAGFTLEFNERSKTPEVRILANSTDSALNMRVYFHSQKKWGITHLRRALYKFGIGKYKISK